MSKINIFKKKDIKKNDTKNGKIKTKLMASFISVCLIPILAVGIFSYIIANTSTTKAFKNGLTNTVEQVNLGIENYIEAQSNQLNTLSSNSNFIDIGISENEKYAQGLLNDVKNSSSCISDTYFGLATFKDKVILSNGELLLKDFNYKEREWYTKAIANKDKIISTEPYKDKTTGKMTVSLARTVSKDGEIIGVIGMDLSLDDISKEYSQIKIGDNGYIFITDSKGTFLSHPNTELIGTDGATKLSIWSKIQENKNGFEKYEYEGASKFAIYDTNNLLGWKVVGSIDQNELLGVVNTILYGICGVGAISLILCIIIAIIISGGIVKNIKLLKKSITNASQGDLSTIVEINSKDEFKELGNDFNIMLKNVSSLVSNVINSSSEVLENSSNISNMSEETTASVNQVSMAIEEITKGATNLAQYSQDSATEMSGLSEQLDGIAEATNKVKDFSSDTQELGSQGLNVVNVLIQKSNENREASTKVSDIINEMDKSTKEITIISDAINQITDQTNLLSLNASIEAARAGEAGRGFAVVAEEIRKLAEQSKASTEDIKKITDTIQARMSTAIKAMSNADGIVVEQKKAVERTEEIFNEIINSVSMLTNKVFEINNSVSDIQVRKDNVLEQIENTSSISEETASLTEEVSASAEEINATMEEFTGYTANLKKLAEKLQEEIKKFKI